MRKFILGLALVVAGLGFVPAPATAAGGYCTGAGVDVVIDYGALGGGAIKGCGQGSTAYAAIESAGFSLTTNARMGGDFVCTVDGKPADGQCTGTNSYWALFIAEPGKGWVYASMGATSQPVSSGQTVSFTWQSSNSRRAPSVSPAAPASKPKTTSAATPATKTKAKTATSATKKHKAAAVPSASAVAPSATASPLAEATASPSTGAAGTTSKISHPKKARPTDVATRAASAYSGSVQAVAHKQDSPGGLPWWAPVGVVALLGAVGVAFAWRRSRASKAS